MFYCTFLPTGPFSFYDPPLGRAGAEIRLLQHCIFLFGGWGGYGNMHAAARQTPISQGSDPVKNALFTGF